MRDDHTKDTVDFHQLKHLVKTAIKLDTRSTSGTQHTGRVGRIPPIFKSILFYVIMGGALSLSIYFIPHAFVGIFLLVTITMAFTAVNIMLEFGNIIISPDDNDIIAPLPVNSRTFFYSKIINLLFYTSIIAISIGIVPTIASIIKSGKISHAFLIPAILLLSSWATSFLIASVYMSLLKFVSRERLSSVLTYVQVIMGAVTYLGYFVIPRTISKDLQHLSDLTYWWIFALPPAWYASLLGLTGDVSVHHWIWSSFIGVAVLAVLYLFLAKYLSIDYAAAIARAEGTSIKAAITPAEHQSKRNSILSRILNREELGVFRLIWAQFKYDNKFKMAVLAILPLTAMYIVIGLTDEGGITDPFVIGNSGGSSNSFLVFFALGIFPIMIKGSVRYSSSYQASWIFFATPSNLSNVILSTRKFLQLFFLIPYLLLFGVIFGFVYGNFIHSAMLILSLYFLVMIELAILYIMESGIPFSQPMQRNRPSGSSWFAMILLPAAVIIVPMQILTRVVFPNRIAYFIVIAALIVLERLTDMLCRRRVESKAFGMRCVG